MRRINAEGLALIKRFEGFSATVYRDVAGKETIGYGHLIGEGEVFGRIDESQAEALLRQDVQVAERAVARLIHVPLQDSQFAALVSFTYNLGGGALQRSTLRQCINRNEDDRVPAQWLRWVWAGGRRWPGLLRRREAELHLYMRPQ
jgi:lysozyme